jgi:hypothetical protein
MNPFPQSVMKWFCFTWIAAMNPSSHAMPAMLSHYAFNGNGNDDLGNSPPMILYNTSFTNGALFCPPPGYSYEAIADVPGLSYDSITVAMDFKPFDDSLQYLNILSCGPGYRWLVINTDGLGHLVVELNNYSQRFAFTNHVATNVWHSIVCSVDIPSQTLVTYLDGQHLPDILLQNFHFDVSDTTNAASEKALSLINYGNATSFFGLADNLKIYRAALTAKEIEAEFLPRINLQSSQGNVLVYWPIDYFVYVAQASPSLSPDATWTNLTAAPLLIGDQNVLVERADASSRFYRLKKL